MSDITLNASMRSNLLSLKNIATQMDKTQLILATGKKVNSAIDNASSYYQARSLTNRAADLTALLDSMGQGIQTIEAANVGIEKATSILEQMTSIANQAGTISQIPSKEDIAQQLGENGAVVTTADELYQAIKDNKETICVYGNIDLGNIDTADKEITLKEGQKLVGAGYFGYSDSEVDKFSSITASATTAKHMINITQDGCEISDLAINYNNENTTGNVYAIAVSGADVTADIGNIDITADFADSSSVKAAIVAADQAEINLNDKVNIQTSGQKGYGIYAYNATANINSGALVNIKTEGSNGFGIYVATNSILNSQSNINIKTAGVGAHAICFSGEVIGNINKNSNIKIETSGGGFGIYAAGKSNLEIAGNIKTNIKDGYGIALSTSSGNTINILSSAQIYFNTQGSEIYNGSNDGNGNNILNIAQGAKLAFEKDGAAKWYQLGEDYKDENDTGKANQITADNVASTIQGIAETSAWTLPTTIENDSTEEKDSNSQNLLAYQNQFNTALKEYDKLLSDCGYQGINLLKGGNLKVVFDENREHVFNILGQDITSKALNINEALWQTQGDINLAIDELNASITTLRSLAEELGNQYSIITTRINFTEALTDVLETGADDLTLADMNEASAQYLSLQTRQQLAINSLSLASMSARSILSLFY